MEPLICLVICLSDWGCAASHMALKDYAFRSPYGARVRLFGDLWHVIGGLRYLGLGALAFYAFETLWHWYVITAVTNSLGWYALKRLHGKDWGWKPTWLKEVWGYTSSSSSSSSIDSHSI